MPADPNNAIRNATEPLETISRSSDAIQALENTDLGEIDNKYDRSSLVFPSNLGQDDNGHYMIININVPVYSQFSAPIINTAFGSNIRAGDVASSFVGKQYLTTPLGPNEKSKVDRLRYPTTPNTPGLDAPFFSVPRGTRRIAESIALYMPTPLVYNTQHAYEEISLTALGGKVGIAALNFAGGAIAAWNSLKTASGLASRALGSPSGSGIGSSTISTVFQLTGNPINPAVEILFSTTAVRQFTFELLLAPRNEEESISMEKIIKTLRFHSSAELNSVTQGLTWIPPADFDITFFNKGVENIHLIRINTCILERVEVDYAPLSGIYSTFRNGYPVAARLSLGFREVEPLHKKRILQGF